MTFRLSPGLMKLMDLYQQSRKHAAGPALTRAAASIFMIFILTILFTSFNPDPFFPDPESPPDRGDMTRLYYGGNFGQALSAALSLLQAGPEDMEILSDMLILFREAGAYREALELIDTLLDGRDDQIQSSKNTTLLTGKGDILFLSGRFTEAAAIYETVISLTSSPSDSAGNSDAGPDPDPDLKLRLGAALLLAGKAPEAAGPLPVSGENTMYAPYAWFLRGEAFRIEGNHADAVSAYRTALRHEPNLAIIHLPLTRGLLETGDIQAARSAAARAVSVEPWNTGAHSLRRFIEDEHPALAAAEIRRTENRRLTASAPKASPLAPLREKVPQLRIGLVEGVTELYLKTGAPYSLAPGNSEEDSPVKGVRGDLIRISEEDGVFHAAVHPDGTGKIIPPGGSLTLRYDTPEATTLLFDVRYGEGYFFAGSEDRSFRGEIRLLLPEKTGAGMTVINIVNLEEYLYSVVPSEMPAWWPAEALRAQAIAARSYTLANLGRFAARGYDLSGSVLSAHYRGFGGEHPRTTAAVNATTGMVLYAEGRPLNTVYSANSGGRTDSAESVWGFPSPLVGAGDAKKGAAVSPADSTLEPAPADEPLPGQELPLPPGPLAQWILSRPDTYSGTAPFAFPAAYRWVLAVPRETIIARNPDFGSDGPAGELVNIITRGRGEAGRVNRVDLIGTKGTVTVRGDSIRSRLGGLRSSLFIVEPLFAPPGEPGTGVSHFLFSGAGWGHGVGMCQTGAAGMAADGFSNREILSHYYPEGEFRTEWGNILDLEPENE